MYRAITNITIAQQPSHDFPNRKTTLYFDFCNEMKCDDSWENLTNKGEIIIPKNIYVRDQNGKLISLGTEYGYPPSNINIGGFSSAAPLLLRGDKVTISFGYKYFNNAGIEITDVSQIFTGWISEVLSKKPLQFKIEDNMWKLKQIPSPIHTFKSTDTLEDILKFLLKGTPFTVNALTKTTFGAFTTGNESVAETLARLRRLYYFESYFRGNELRSGAIVYIESEAKNQIFAFQQNIISDELEYKRRDDLTLSAVATSVNQNDTGEACKDGSKKTKKTRLEVLVTFRPDGSITQFVKQKGIDYPPNTGGERHSFHYIGVKTIPELVSLAIHSLQKYYYTGFRGKFVSFAIPYVKMGDNAVISDPILPERNGTYKIKKVEYSASTSGGLRQEIYLDYKLQ